VYDEFRSSAYRADDTANENMSPRTLFSVLRNAAHVGLTFLSLFLLGYPPQTIASDPLMIPTPSPFDPTGLTGGETSVRVGTIASSEQICDLFSHPIFNQPPADYEELDAINLDFSWDGIEAAPLWVAKKFSEAGVAPSRLSLDQDSGLIANRNLSSCLETLDRERADVYNNLRTFFLQYLLDACYEQEYDVEKTVDDDGTIVENRTLREGKACIDFDYNSGNYGNWNSTTLALMLIWREAHPILQRVLDQGHQVLVSRVQRRDQERNTDRLAQLERQQAAQERADDLEQQWQRYVSRTKSFMEEVFNFASTGTVAGTKYERWTEIQKCVMTNGRTQIDSRKINMTAFRVSRQKYPGDVMYLVSSDGSLRLATPATVPIDRLQNAWRQAFQECPGTTSRF